MRKLLWWVVFIGLSAILYLRLPTTINNISARLASRAHARFVEQEKTRFEQLVATHEDWNAGQLTTIGYAYLQAKEPRLGEIFARAATKRDAEWRDGWYLLAVARYNQSHEAATLAQSYGYLEKAYALDAIHLPTLALLQELAAAKGDTAAAAQWKQKRETIIFVTTTKP